MAESDVTNRISWLEPLDALSRFMKDKSDPRTQNWFLVGNVNHLLSIVFLYVAFCLKIGPWIMRDRKPFDLRNTLLLYNVLNVLASAYLVYEGFQAAWLRDYSYKCEPVDFSNSPKALRVANCVWFYYMVKVFDLADTVFFILRKKSNQVSFLHLYHHAAMPLAAFIAIRFIPGGHGTLLGVINSMVHVVMYTYYFLAALGPAYHKFLFWKKYITILQMVQFVIIFMHFGQLFFRECNYPRPLVALACINDIFMTYLFGVFYYRTYIKKKED